MSRPILPSRARRGTAAPRVSGLFLPLLALSLAASCPAQQAAKNAPKNDPPDARPTGKYLVEICTLSGALRTLSCTRTPLPPVPDPKKPQPAPAATDALPQPISQSISVNLTCDPSSKAPCKAQTPVAIGADFFVAATSDSGLPVRQEVISGNATPAGGIGTVRYRANAPGLIVVRATADGNPRFAAAAPVDLLLRASVEAPSPGCAVLPPPGPAQSTPLDAATIASLMGNPTPFVVTAQGPNTLAIYAASVPLSDSESRILGSFQQAIAALAGRTPGSLGITPAPGKQFTVELAIAHAAALGDLGARINGLNYSQFTVLAVGADKIRVTATSRPDCDTWTAFLKDIRRMAWQVVSEPMSTKLYYLSSSDVAAAFNGPTPAAAPAAKAPLAMASVAVAAGNGEQTPPDLLVYSDANPGDDGQIAERNRVLALLDLPRPEMIINAWVTQNSSASPNTIGAFGNMVKGLVADYDRQFESVVLRGWQSVKQQSAAAGYFNEAFRSYIEDRFVTDTPPASAGGNAQELSQAFLDSSQAKLADPPSPATRQYLGLCERGRYCLGYNDLFHPVKPALTDLLLTIVAAQNPVLVADTAAAAVEGHPAGVAPALATTANCDAAPAAVRTRCRAIWTFLDLDRLTPPPGAPTCVERDYRGTLSSLLRDAASGPRVLLQCFQETVDSLLAPADPSGAPPYGAGLIRAAIADFLFNYKMSQQYPHEFNSYDLKHSADALNTALSPIIDAFNRDLTSFQLFVRADMQHRVDVLNYGSTDARARLKKIFGLDKPSFFNDGLITVRTISGQPSNVNTASQSYLNASTAPELNTLLGSLAGNNTNTSGAGSLASTVLSGNPLARTEALAGALANYQTTFAQIGRQLNFSAIPRSLATASAAEIAVTLNADESTSPPLYTGGGATDPATNTSRVAQHDTVTRVRVDSIKLFELSSFSAIVERSRSRFPLLPPFVEIPYIGTLAGIPLGAAKEFHNSSAVISAYVVPTAADIAYGLRFASDLVVDGINPGPCSFYKGAAGPDVASACLFRRALSLRDLNRQPVGNFNREMIRCLASDTTTAGCRRVSFDSVPTMY